MFVEWREVLPSESVEQHAEELYKIGLHAGGLGEPVDVHLGRCAEVQERDEQAADEEESVDGEWSVADRLEQDVGLDHLPEHRVVWKTKPQLGIVFDVTSVVQALMQDYSVFKCNFRTVCASETQKFTAPFLHVLIYA